MLRLELQDGQEPETELAGGIFRRRTMPPPFT